ncbi:hypothetical protein GGR53DRAFT_467682 [Hypoxylon sp. FL1150]|nr:hypothetical protein GGR53DRAFT_467682 [Hypoxylon sp. FL1150]
MAPGQNTFSIIPNAPCAINTGIDSSQPRAAARPMTTKQARKAYQQKNKGPKLSKAEQRRRDLFEQDRIRKEFEKEKNQARAKAARDKKKEKEEKERAERKKRGLPLVDVHPSQDTIAWFVRGDRRKQETRTASPATVDADDSDSGVLSAQDDPEPSLKKQKTELSVPKSPEPECRPSSARVPLISQSPAPVPNTREATTDDSDPVQVRSTPEHQNFGLDDAETVDELLDELVNIPSSLPNESEATWDSEPSLKEHNTPILDQPSPPKPPDGRPRSPISTQKSYREQKAEDSASLPSVRQPLHILVTNEVNSKSNDKPKEHAPNHVKLPTPMKDPIVDSPIQVSRKSLTLVPAPPLFRHPKTPMGPPRLPPRFKTPNHTPANVSRTPQFLAKQPNVPKFKSTNSPISRPHKDHTPQRTAEDQPPTSTQLFMISHLDDFFPSPSQEVREVFGESRPSIGKVGYQSMPKPVHPTRSYLGRNPLSNSTPSMLNINRAIPEAKESRNETGLTRETKRNNRASSSTSPLAADTRSSDNSEAFHMPFFSTQDLFLSSQDIKDIQDETPSSLGVKQGQNSNAAPSNYAPKTTSPSLFEATRSKSGLGPNPPVPRLASKRAEKPELNSGTKSIDARNRSPYPQVSNTANEGYRGSAAVRSNFTTPSAQGGRARLSRGDLGEEAKPTEIGKPHATSQSPKPQAPGTSQTKRPTVHPRPSPKPFFRSSCREAQYKYIIERNKTTGWKSPAARQKVQQDLDHLMRSEDERLNSLLREAASEGERPSSISNSVSDSKAPSGSTLVHGQPKSQSPPPTINQLARPSQRNREPSEDRRKRNRTRSSYDLMLEELEGLDRKGKQKQKQEQQAPTPVPAPPAPAAVPASQETDYGDMSVFHHARRRRRCRSSSAPPSHSARSEGEAIPRFVIEPIIPKTDDLETMTYKEARHRRDVLSLVDDCSGECTATHHKVGWRKYTFRRHQVVRRFTDANIEYDQQLMYLDFHLDGPEKIHFLREDDAEEAEASLRRAKTAVADAGLHMRRAAYLWERRGSLQTDMERFAKTRPEHAGTSRFLESRGDALFWEQVRPRFDKLLKTVQEEVLRIRYVVYCLDSAKKQEVGYYQSDFSRGWIFKRLMLCDFTSQIQNGPPERLHEMSGALQGVEVRTNLTFLSNLKVKFEKIQANDITAAEAPAGTWIRYKFIKHCNKRRKPEDSIAAWAAFRRDLDSTSKPLNSGTALLKNKVETKIILAERQLRQLMMGEGDEKDASGANGGSMPRG